MSGKGVFSHYFSKVQSIISGTCTATTKSQVHIYNNAVVHYFVLFIVQISVQKFFFANFFLCNTCAATHLAACVVIIFNLLSMYVFSCTCAKLYFYTGCPLWNTTKVKVFLFGTQTLFCFTFMFVFIP